MNFLVLLLALLLGAGPQSFCTCGHAHALTENELETPPTDPFSHNDYQDDQHDNHSQLCCDGATDPWLTHEDSSQIPPVAGLIVQTDADLRTHLKAITVHLSISPQVSATNPLSQQVPRLTI